MNVSNQQSRTACCQQPESLGRSRGLRVAGYLGVALFATLALAGPASAGCGLTVTFDNDMNKKISVLEIDTKATGGNYKTVYDKTFTVGAGKKKTKAIETNAGCALPHHIRVKYEKGNNTLYKTKGPMVTAVDKKIKMEFDD